MPNQIPLDLSELSQHELEVVKFELEQFFQTKLYQVFLSTCDSTKDNLLDSVLGASLRGVESLFTREAIMGESQGWKNMKQVFIELLETINDEIKRKHKP